MINIKIPEETYNMFSDRYSELHKDIIENCVYFLQEMEDLLHTKEGFHADLISEMLETAFILLKEIHLQQLQDDFEKMEETVKNYLLAMQNEDCIQGENIYG